MISQLKAQIFEIQQRDKDFLALRDQLYSIQSKYRHLQDEKVSKRICYLSTEVYKRVSSYIESGFLVKAIEWKTVFVLTKVDA